MRHTQSRFPFPLVRPYFTAESLRGWWDGVVGREGQQQHRATTPTATPPLFRTPCGQRSHLEPNAVAALAGETRQRRRRQHNDNRRHSTTDRDNETNTAAGAAARKRAAQQQKQSRTGQTNSRNKAGKAEREKGKTPAQPRPETDRRRRRSNAGRDRHPPRRVLHTTSGKASIAARMARRPYIHTDHLRSV